MTISIIGRSFQDSGGSSFITVSAPSGTVDGDLLVLFLSSNGAATITPPTGWTVRVGTGQVWQVLTGVYSGSLGLNFTGLGTGSIVTTVAVRNLGVTSWPSSTTYGQDATPSAGVLDITPDLDPIADGDLHLEFARTYGATPLTLSGTIGSWSDSASGWAFSGSPVFDSGVGLDHSVNGASGLPDPVGKVAWLQLHSLIEAATGPLTASGSVGVSFSWTPDTTSTVDGWSISGLPAGLSYYPLTGEIFGTPTVGGTFDVTVNAFADSVSLTDPADTKTLTLTISGGGGGGGTPPEITSSLTASGEVGVSFSYSIVATNTPTSYAAGNLPPGLSVNTGTGAITGTPTTGGVWSSTITATNGDGSDTATLVITIGAAPVITSPLTASGGEGVPFTYHCQASGTTPIMWTASGLPAWASLNPSTGFITGTPDDTDSWSVDITATNDYGDDTETLVITTGAVPAITSATYAEGQVGVPFTFWITATNSPTYFDIGTLPPGLAINHGTGAITGTPTRAGVTNTTVSASNPSVGTGSIQFRITTPQADHEAVWSFSSLTLSDLGEPADVVVSASVLLFDWGAEPVIDFTTDVEGVPSFLMEPDDGED